MIHYSAVPGSVALRLVALAICDMGIDVHDKPFYDEEADGIAALVPFAKGREKRQEIRGEVEALIGEHNAFFAITEEPSCTPEMP